jgi:hypothetical protein
MRATFSISSASPILMSSETWRAFSSERCMEWATRVAWLGAAHRQGRPARERSRRCRDRDERGRSGSEAR